MKGQKNTEARSKSSTHGAPFFPLLLAYGVLAGAALWLSAALNPPPSSLSRHGQFLKRVCTSAGKLLGRFLSSGSGWRTAFQIGHATPSSDTESQRSTRPPHPRLSACPVCVPSSSGPLHPQQCPAEHGMAVGRGSSLTPASCHPSLPLAPPSNYHCEKFLSILPHHAPSTQTSLTHRSKQPEHPPTGTKDDDCRDPPRRRHQLAAAAASAGGRGQPGSQHSPAQLCSTQLFGRLLFEKLLPSLFGWGRASKGCREGHPGGDLCTGREEPSS